MGHVSFVVNQSSMADLSKLCPSRHITGSFITSDVMGHRCRGGCLIESKGTKKERPTEETVICPITQNMKMNGQRNIVCPTLTLTLPRHVVLMEGLGRALHTCVAGIDLGPSVLKHK